MPCPSAHPLLRLQLLCLPSSGYGSRVFQAEVLGCANREGFCQTQWSQSPPAGPINGGVFVGTEWLEWREAIAAERGLSQDKGGALGVPFTLSKRIFHLNKHYINAYWLLDFQIMYGKFRSPPRRSLADSFRNHP